MMAATTTTNHKNHKNGFNLTRAEVDRLESALKDETFVKLLADYARELADPAKKAVYEAEIAQLEAERGYDVSFIHPKPGYVIKVEEKETKQKIFINICSEVQIGTPTSVSTSQGGQSGLKWSIPYSLSKPREDVDNKGSGCVVYDAIFHPDTLYLASRDTRIKTLVHNTAFDALKSTFKVQVDASQIKYPKLKFKGVFHPTVIRKPKNISPEVSIGGSGDQAESTIEFLEKAVHITPSYSIKYRSPTDIQDFLLQSTDVLSSRPKEMIVEIQLPKLDSAANLDLDVQEKNLSLIRDTPPKHKLTVELPYPVDENNGNAKFDKSKKCLIVTLPVKPAAPLMKTERLSSNDSGIDMEEISSGKNGDAAASTDVHKHVVNGDKVEGYRTGEKMDNKSVSKCDNNNKKKRSRAGKKGKKERKGSESCSSPPLTSENIVKNGEEISNSNVVESNDGNDEAVVENVIQSIENVNGVATGDVNVENNLIESKNADNIQHSEIRTKIGFLEEDISYSLPNFTHTVFDDIMILTLEVKNVSEESIEFVCFDKWKSLHVKFVSLGSGHFPIHHAFYLDFLQIGSFVEEDIRVECWDNNVVLQFPWVKSMAQFRVGVSSGELMDKEHAIQKSAPMELSLKTDEENKSPKDKKFKSTDEKHPKKMNSDSPDKKKANKDEKKTESKETKSGETAEKSGSEPQDFTSVRDRHSSGESIDSSMSMSPYDTILLEQQHIKHLEQLQENEELKETGSDSEEDGTRKQMQRSVSVEEGVKMAVMKPRSILKRTSMPSLVGSRFRCYSESNMSEDMGSVGQLSAGISETTISEEGETIKKTVRFAEKTQQKLYRIGSSIMDAKRRAIRRKKTAERKRRLSEGDTVEVVGNTPQANGNSIVAAKTSAGQPKAASLDSNNWEQESHDDSGLSSSLEETTIIDGEAGNQANKDDNNQKSKKRTKKRTKTFSMSNDLIFDLDI